MRNLKLRNILFSQENLLTNSEKKKACGGIIPPLPICEYGFRVCQCGNDLGTFCHPVGQECPKLGEYYICIDHGW